MLKRLSIAVLLALGASSGQAAVPLYDTTAIHADAAVAWALE